MSSPENERPLPRSLPRSILATYAVPEPGRDLEDRLMTALGEEGLLGAGPARTRSKLWTGIGLAMGAAAVLLLAILLLRGDGVRTIEGGTRVVAAPTTFRLADRVVAMAAPGAALATLTRGQGPVRVRQDAGSVIYRAEETALTVETDLGEVRVDGTCFQVVLDGRAGGLTVRVYDGRVRVVGGGTQLVLASRDSGVISQPGQAPIRTQEWVDQACPISDSRFSAAAEPLPGPAAGTPDQADEWVAPEDAPRVAAADRIPDPVGDLVLEGQVLDPDGLPAEGVTVTLSAKPPRSVVTGKDGTFSFDRLVPQRHTVVARRGDLAGGPVFHRLTAESDPVVLRLRTGTSLIVEVTDQQTGTGIPGARVEPEQPSLPTLTTGADGTARYQGLVQGGLYLRVSAEGHAPERQYVVVPQGATQPVVSRIPLGTGASLAGRVVDADGRPVEGAEIVAIDALDFKQVATPRHDGPVSGPEGRFEFPVLSAGTYRLMATHPRHASGWTEPFELDGRRARTGIEIAMGESALVRGRVEDERGQPLPWAMVVYGLPRGDPARGSSPTAGGLWGSALADQEGAFEFEGLPRKKIILAVSTEDRISDEIEVDLTAGQGDEDLVLTARPAGVISGTVVDSKGEPAPEVQVKIMADFADGTYDKALTRSAFREIMTDGAGGFEFRGLVEGTYEVSAHRSAGQRDIHEPSRVRARTGDRDVRVVVTGTGGIRGRLVRPDGSHPTRFQVAIGIAPAISFASDDGSFELRQLTPRQVQITVKGPDFASRTLDEVTIEEGRTTDLGTIQIQPGRTISGRVLEADGSPVPGAQVVCGTSVWGDGEHLAARMVMRNPSVTQRATISGPDGSFRLSGFGSRKLVAVADHARLGRSLAIEIPEGDQDAQVELTLARVGSLSGTVRMNGQPLGFASVNVRSGDVKEQTLSVQTGADGAYFIARLPTGQATVVVYPPRSGAHSFERDQVDIHPGERARLDFDLRQGDIELGLTFQPAPGAKVDAAWVFLLPGQVRAATGADIRAIARNPGSKVRMSFNRTAQGGIMTNLEPGDYSLCAIPITGDPDDDAFFTTVQKHMDHLGVTCRPLQIPSSPKQQSATLLLPSMTPLPE